MKNKIIYLLKSAIFIIALIVIYALTFIGYFLFFISKIIRSLAFLFTLNFDSAKEEITDFRLMVSLKDAFK